MLPESGAGLKLRGLTEARSGSSLAPVPPSLLRSTLVLVLAASAGLARAEPAQQAEPAQVALRLSAAAFGWLGERAPALDLPRAGEGREDASAALDWSEERTWRRWSQALERLESPSLDGESAAEARARARAALAELALAQGRHDDAWRHLAHARALPDDELAALVARFVPGVVGAPAGGPFGPLAAGSRDAEPPLLAPALAPPLEPEEASRTRRELTLEGLRVGEARLSLRVALEPEGVQVDLEHRGGGPTRLRVRVPRDPRLEPLALLVDWEERERLDEEVLLELGPESARHTLWLRCVARPPLGPSALPEQVPAGLALGGIVLASMAQPPSPLLAAARALGERTGLFCRVSEVHDAPTPPAPAPAGLLVLLRPGDAGQRELAHLVHLVEAWTLRERP